MSKMKEKPRGGVLLELEEDKSRGIGEGPPACLGDDSRDDSDLSNGSPRACSLFLFDFLQAWDHQTSSLDVAHHLTNTKKLF